jgi:hypothetical protein
MCEPVPEGLGPSQSAEPTKMEENLPNAGDKMKAAVFGLWDRFKGTMFARLGVIEQTYRAALKAPLNEERRRDAEKAAHKLAGSLGTFGLGEGSKLAAKLETMFQGPTPFSPDEMGRLRELTELLRTEIERGPTPPAHT